MNIRRQRLGHVADVSRPPVGGLDVPNEISEVACDVDNASVGWDELLKEAAQLPPDRFLAGLVGLIEALLVDLFEDDRRWVFRRAVGGLLGDTFYGGCHWYRNDSARFRRHLVVDEVGPETR